MTREANTRKNDGGKTSPNNFHQSENKRRQRQTPKTRGVRVSRRVSFSENQQVGKMLRKEKCKDGKRNGFSFLDKIVQLERKKINRGKRGKLKSLG